MRHDLEPLPLDDALLARIDQFVERLAAQQPGLKPNRSDAIRG